MVLERLYVIPHGDEIIDVPNQESRELRDKITEVTREDNSDSIIVLTPPWNDTFQRDTNNQH